MTNDEPFDTGQMERLPDSTEVTCPYCGEMVELDLDPGGGVSQEYVQDCEVCCRPWLVKVTFGRHGAQAWVVEAA